MKRLISIFLLGIVAAAVCFAGEILPQAIDSAFLETLLSEDYEVMQRIDEEFSMIIYMDELGFFHIIGHDTDKGTLVDRIDVPVRRGVSEKRLYRNLNGLIGRKLGISYRYDEEEGTISLESEVILPDGPIDIEWLRNSVDIGQYITLIGLSELLEQELITFEE